MGRKSWLLITVFMSILHLLLAFPAYSLTDLELQEGDIIFQESSSWQSEAIQLGTGSRYSHCGLILNKNGLPYVFEAARTVQYTPLKDWISRGKNGHFLVMRYQPGLDRDQLAALKAEAGKFEGKKYDIYFLWSDDQIYCSELVWKIFDRALNVQLTPLKTFRDFDLGSSQVRAEIRNRFGDQGNLPLDEKVVAPSDLIESPLLVKVVSQN